MKVRTRFAPSPSGALHLGNARTAVLNWALARRHGGSFVLRIEDTDRRREDPDAEKAIVDGLAWLGLEPDEGPDRGGPRGPYRQSERDHLHRSHAERLLDRGRAYRCFCTPDELEARREAALETGESPAYDGRCRNLPASERERLRAEGREPSVRFRVAPGEVRFRDRVRGEIAVETGTFGDFVILRSDGRATYNFAAVVDDLLMEITHVIRGGGHLSNTPKQVALYRALDADPPVFAHVPMVLAPGGGPLSKRAGARSLEAYRREGYHPDAVVNYLSLLGWSSESGDEFLPRDRIVDEADLDRVGVADTELDPDKMRWLSGRHIAAEPPGWLAERLGTYLEAEGLELDERERRAVAELARDRVQLLTRAAEEARELFAEPEPEGEAARALADPEAGAVLAAAREAWSGLRRWAREEVRRGLAEARQTAPVGGAAFYHPLRAALTGALEGPDLGDVAWVIGRERTLERLARASDG